MSRAAGWDGALGGGRGGVWGGRGWGWPQKRAVAEAWAALGSWRRTLSRQDCSPTCTSAHPVPGAELVAEPGAGLELLRTLG